MGDAPAGASVGRGVAPHSTGTAVPAAQRRLAHPDPSERSPSTLRSLANEERIDRTHDPQHCRRAGTDVFYRLRTGRPGRKGYAGRRRVYSHMPPSWYDEILPCGKPVKQQLRQELMASPKWVFERLTRDGGASGEAVPNAVEAGGWASSEELLVREAIQNSVDAWLPGAGPVRVSFRLQHHVEREKEFLLEGVSLKPFMDRVDAFRETLPSGNVIEKSSDPGAPLHLLYIEDFNTVGLGGGLQDPKHGHFFRLLFLIGEGSKADNNDGSGGSFGFGKGVYAHNSNIRMIFVFSVFEPSQETNHTWARLLGCAYLPGHEFQEEQWTGRAWFGLPPDEKEIGQAPYPIIDEEAVLLAEKLGFSPRPQGDFGTSVLIVGCDSQEGIISAEKLKTAAETWWWPRLIDGDLNVELFEQGVRVPGLDPAGRMDLQPFIRCRNAIRRGHGDDDVAMHPFNRKHGLNLGELALTAIHPDHPSHEALNRDSDDAEDRQGKAPAHRSVAYIRRPGMVVTYRAWSMASLMSAVGAFEAHGDVDRYLKLSEPMEHDRWDPHSRRLDRLPNGHAIVKAIEEGIRRRLRDFLKALQPPPPPPKAGLNWLGRRLGELLTPRTKGSHPGPEGERGSVSIFTESKPQIVLADDGSARMEASYSIALKPDLDLEQSLVRFSPRLNILEGDTGTRGDPISLSVRLQADGAASSTGETPDLPVLLSAGERRVVEVSSASFSADWAVAIHIEVAELSAGEE